MRSLIPLTSSFSIINASIRVWKCTSPPHSILVDAHPHIGTDKLPRVIENMRNTIIECGGEVHFQTRMDALIIENDEVKGIETNTGKTFLGPVILATGHSARDVYRWLAANNVTIEAKGIAVGVRLEHPAMLIDQIQYHNKNGRGKYLPAAEYSFVTQAEGRGVYSFCMCPGGFIVPAASGPEQVVVNGMSPANPPKDGTPFLQLSGASGLYISGTIGYMYLRRIIRLLVMLRNSVTG